MSYRPITDMWLLCRGKTGFYGTYPAGFLERARYLLGVQLWDPVLHVCGGKVKEYQSGPMKGKGLGPNDKTVDLDADLAPDFHLDVRRIGVNPGDVYPFWTPGGSDKQDGVDVGEFEVTENGDGPFSSHGGADRRPWAACLIDRPYTAEDAAHYAPGSDALPPLNDLLRRALSVTRVGGRVGVLDYYWPRPPREGVTLVACIGVTVGWGNRIRVFAVYERTAYNPLEYNVTNEPDEHAQMMEGETPEPEIIDVSTDEPLTDPTAGKSVVIAAPEDIALLTPKKKKKTKKKRRRTSLTDGFGA